MNNASPRIRALCLDDDLTGETVYRSPHGFSLAMRAETDSGAIVVFRLDGYVTTDGSLYWTVGTQEMDGHGGDIP